MKKCLVIYNPHSGRQYIKKYLPEIKNILNKKGYDTIIESTKYKGHAINIVTTAPKVDLVMSFGGDGTFNEVMTGNFKRKEKLVLTHIPVGTTNDIGAMLGYTKDIINNVKLSLNGEIKDFDIGLINDRPFVYIAGFGKYTNISYETPSKLKHKIGYLAYLKEAISSFFKKTELYDITYEIDGKKTRGLFSIILISNANHIAGIKNIYKDVLLDDNQFEVIICNLTKKKDILKSLYFFTQHGISQVPGLYFYRTNNLKIKINDEENKEWCIDGEKLENSSNNKYNIKIENKVKILIPKKNISKLFKENTKKISD